MDHRDATERGLVALYRSGRLDPEEERRFEEHFFACPECQEELEFQRRFEMGIRLAESELSDPATGSAPAKEGRGGKLLRFPSRPLLRFALAASLLIAASATFAWLWQSRAAFEREAAVWRDRAQRGEAERKALAVRAAQSERLAGESEARARALEDRIAQTPPERREPEPLARPMAGTALVLLTHLRGSEAGVANRLDLRSAPGIVQLALDPGGATGYSSYRVVLSEVSGAGGKSVYQGAGLQPNALEVILLTFPRDFLKAGEYRVRLEGRRADGGYEGIDVHRLRVVR